ncbi:MAG: hypothetical protein GEU95_00140 [Rhizobiales bacterium]|nr:hypothetical protein [Hyphomicrobiales bacterium]
MGQDAAGKTQAQDQPVAAPSQDNQSPQEPSLLTTADDQSLTDDVLHAAHVLPPEMIANVELTLDHLSETVDLFDVPPFDYGDAV